MYKKDYAFKTLKRPQAFLNHIKGMNLVSLTISMDDLAHQGMIKPTYLTTQAKYDKDDFKTLEFSLFSNQTVLINYLHQNASGLYHETQPLTFLVEGGVPSFKYRKFRLSGVDYVLAHVSDAGLVYHMLFGNKGFVMPIGMTNKIYDNQIDLYNILSLINYGLIGRNTGIKLTGSLAMNYEYDLDQTFITYSKQVDDNILSNEYRIRFINQSAKLNFIPDKTWEKITVKSDKESLQDFAKGQGLPKFKVELYPKVTNQKQVELDYQWLA